MGRENAGCALALSDTLCNKYNITEYGRSCLPCTALPYSHTAARPRWVTPFYVLRYFLRVGTLRAQDSKCHSRHFFTPKVRSQNAGHTTVREQYFQLCGLRPRIKRHCCTFEGTSRKNAGPSSKVRSHNAAHLHQNRT